MGKLFDSIKRRNGTTPAVVSEAPPQRLHVVPAAPPAEDLEPMPFYEVPASDGAPAATVSIARAHVPVPERRPSQPIQPARASDVPPSPAAVTFTPAEPAQRRSTAEIDERVVVIRRPDTSPAREYRELAEHLARLATARQVRSLMLLPLDDRQPVAAAAANLGCAWAEFTRHPLVLVDAARSQPGQDLATLLGVDAAPGWEELMTGAALGETIQQTGRSWLDLVGSGRRLAWANTQAWAKRAGGVLHALGKHYRHVLLLGPAYPHSPLGLVLAETTDSACIIVPAGQPNHPQKEPLLQAIARQGGQVLGTIVLDHV